MNLETFKKVLSLTPNQTFMHVGHTNGSGVLYTIKETFNNVLVVDAAQLADEVDIFEIFGNKSTAGSPERASDGACFKAVGQTGADVIGFDQREDLSLILQSPETSGKNDPVEIPLERGTLRGEFARLSAAQPVGGKQLFPLH